MGLGWFYERVLADFSYTTVEFVAVLDCPVCFDDGFLDLICFVNVSGVKKKMREIFIVICNLGGVVQWLEQWNHIPNAFIA